MILTGNPKEDATRLIDEWRADGCSDAEIRKLATDYEYRKIGQAILDDLPELHLIKCPKCLGINIRISRLIEVIETQGQYGREIIEENEASEEYEEPISYHCRDCDHLWTSAD